MEMFEKKDQTSPTPSSASYHHEKKVGSPIPAFSSTYSSSASSLHNSNPRFSATPSPNDSGYDAGVSDSPKDSDTSSRTYLSAQSSSDSITPTTAVHKEPLVTGQQSTSTSSPANVPQHEEPPSDVVEGLRAVALWDYQAADGTEISFDPDDIITEIDQVSIPL
ncbi:hypothetical protein COOONC_11642 [Cooperia oncophora]